MSEDDVDGAGEAMSSSQADDGPALAARTFIDAVAWGEHETVWTLLASGGRDVVLSIATKRGMDEELVNALRDGSAVGPQRDEFLGDLVNGFRADLSGNNLDTLEYEHHADPAEPGKAKIIANTPLPPALGGTLPVADLDLVDEGGEWKVDRLLPRTSKS